MQTIDTETGAPPKTMLPQPKGEGEVSLLDLLIALARRKKLIAVTTLVFMVTAALISLLLPSRYTATTVILPPQNQSAGSSLLLSQLNNSLGPMAALAGGGLGIKNPNDMYVAMLKSRTVEDAMVNRFDLRAEYHQKRQSDARKRLEDRCDIESSPKDGLIRISLTDHDPNRAAEMTNAYIEEYKKLSGTLAVTEAAQRRLFFEQQLEQAKDKLANAEEALKKTEQTTGMFQMDSQARALVETAASLRAQIAAKEVEIHSMRSFASEQNPDLLLAEQQLAGWQAQLSRLTGKENGTEDDLLLSRGQVPGAGLEYVRKIRDVKYYETIFELLAKQYEMAKLDEAKQGSVIQVVDRAVPPDRRSFPKRTPIVLGATVVGLLGAIFWVLAGAGLAAAEEDPEAKARIEELRQLLGKTPAGSQ